MLGFSNVRQGSLLPLLFPPRGTEIATRLGASHYTVPRVTWSEERVVFEFLELLASDLSSRVPE